MTPDLRVSADGRDITASILDRLLSAEVRDVVDEEVDAFEMALDDRPPGIEVPPTGATLDVDLALGAAFHRLGSYVVNEIEQETPPATLTIRAAAADLLGDLKAPRTRSWSAMTIGDVVGTLAGRHDLEPHVDPELRNVLLSHIDQTDESDLELLRRLASYQLDVVAKVTSGRLVFLRRQSFAAEAASAAVRIERADGIEWRMLTADRDRYVAVVARWRDFTAGDLQELRVGTPTGGPVDVLAQTFPDRAAAANAAETRLRALQRATRSGNVTVGGRPELSADLPVRLIGWGASDGVWMAHRVRHQLSADGYRTHLDIEAVTEPWDRTDAELLPEAPFAGAVQPISPSPGGTGTRVPGGTPAPNLAHIVDRVAAEHPSALQSALHSYEFARRVVAALRTAAGPRWGHFRDSNGILDPGAVSYYRGEGDPVEGSMEIAVRAIVQGFGQLFPSWADVTGFYSGTWARGGVNG